MGVDEWLVNAVIFMYKKAYTLIKTKLGNLEEFKIKVVVHQGSILSPFLFVTVLEALSNEIRVTI